VTILRKSIEQGSIDYSRIEKECDAHIKTLDHEFQLVTNKDAMGILLHIQCHFLWLFLN